MVVRKAKASWKIARRLIAPPSLPVGTLACPHLHPFGISTGLEDEQWGPIVPASHPKDVAFTDSLRQRRGKPCREPSYGECDGNTQFRLRERHP